MTLEERIEYMTDRYGEVCTKGKAAHILCRSTAMIRTMINDGRLEAACEGKMVELRSIARYINAPEEADFEAHKHRVETRYKSNWSV